ncbi:dihydroneopterin aldolase [Palleronia sp. LCG004]|uniref:dihydroneopterin aldolase n=1 Tax=Palleronia sp. LCG004 TaxID=3079304 RepID=UPI002943C94A|nr:dihydroneopterin aldolase [Palleronia sp. LCG004]WOI57115.1 dihydroneopterin aldolase [Palleronia sp. LCG004]
MASDLRMAFEHPEARAAATGPDRPHDRISLRDHVVEVEIGAFQAERGRTQRVCFNVVVEVRPHEAELADDVDRILSYDRITEAIAAELDAERLNLLETLAERIADRILTEPLALRCFVRIEKLDRGPGALGVEIVRSAASERRLAEETDAPRPFVVYLSNAAIASPKLRGWIDRIAARGPAILCVGAPNEASPRSDAEAAQRRIDLCALEQNAWVLAGRDPRAVVVGTRTELDWAMRHGHVSVWAPSKLVLDAVAPPETGPRDGAGLCLWFADQMRAREILFIGADAPGGQSVPTMKVDAEDLP